MADRRAVPETPYLDDASLDMGVPPRSRRLYGRSGRAALTAGTLAPVGDDTAREDVHGNVEVRDFDGYDADDMKHSENLVEAKKADLIRECNEVIREWEAEAEAEVDPRYRVSEMKPCFGARCTSCGAWLTKWDFTPEDAAESAAQALETHSCSLPRERAV